MRRVGEASDSYERQRSRSADHFCPFRQRIGASGQLLAKGGCSKTTCPSARLNRMRRETVPNPRFPDGWWISGATSNIAPQLRRGGNQMSVEANKAAVRRCWEEIWNKGNLAHADESHFPAS
jgi:hypothetical protein